MDISSAVKWGLIVSLVLALLGAAWAVVSYIGEAAVTKEQAKQLIQIAAERDKARAEQNQTWARFQDLPEVRNRICATRAATDGCCKPAPAECKP